MQTECTQTRIDFQPLGRRQVVADFDGGAVTSDGGVVLLAEVENKRGVVARFAQCFTDHRNPDLVEHSLAALLKQRIFGICQGYEDLVDHDAIRRDPAFAAAVGKQDPAGDERSRARDRGCALAGKSTLNRIERSVVRADADSRYAKTPLDIGKAQRLLVDFFLEAHAAPPAQIILDFDATDDRIHGAQAGRFFHGYYKHDCYLPLYVFCGDHLLHAKLRPSNLDGSAGALKVLQELTQRIRAAWPEVQIVVRGDSGFCREHLMAWCEANQIDYVFGLAKNSRLRALLAAAAAQAKRQFEATGEAARVFAEFEYQTLDSWSRARRVTGKAEHLEKGPNPRFVVTSLSAEATPMQALYEESYCGRGEMENRIKEQQGMMFADRTSASTMRANQIRLLFSSYAYVLMTILRSVGLAGTAMAEAQCDTIRLRLLKIGAQVCVTVRKVWIHYSETYSWRAIFERALANLRAKWSNVAPLATVAPNSG